MSTEQWVIVVLGCALLISMILNVILSVVALSFSRSQRLISSIQSGLDQSIGQLRTYADDVRKDYRRLDQILRVPTEQGSLGEVFLERMLSDQLPRDMYEIRKECLPGTIPDAHVRYTDGSIICIDSKFSLTKYTQMRQAEDERLKDHCRKEFIRTIKGNLEDIASKYIKPAAGTAGFAFAFIPCEAVYHFLQTDGDALELLRASAKRGVLTVSPITMSLALELIARGIRDVKLNETAKDVREYLQVLAKRFDNIEEQWRTYRKRFDHIQGTAANIDREYGKLRREFIQVMRDSQITFDGKAGEGGQIPEGS